MQLQKGLVLAGLLGWLLIGRINAQPTSAGLNLQDCLKTALANNITVKQQQLLLQTANANYSQAKHNRLPIVSADMSYGINNGRSIDPFTNSYNNQQLASSNANVSSIIPIFTGWQTQNRIAQNKLTLEASKLDYQQEQDNLTLNVILAFLQVINNEDVLALTKKQAGITGKQVERNEVLSTEGSIAPATLSDLKGQFAAEELAIVSADNALQSSRLALLQLMNIPYSKDLQIDRSDLDLALSVYPATAEQVYSAALQKFSIVKAADFRKKAAAKGIKVAAAAGYPTLSLFGQVSTNYSSAAQRLFANGSTDVTTDQYVTFAGNNLPVIAKQTSYKGEKISYGSQLNNNFSSFIGVNLSIPIFSALQTKTNVNLARIREKEAVFISENARLQLRQSIEQAHLNMTTAYSRHAILLKQVEAFQESFRAAEIKLNEGVGNSVDYLIVKNNLDRAKLNLTNAQYDYLLRTTILDFYQGQLK